MATVVRVGVVDDQAESRAIALSHLARFQEEHQDVRIETRTYSDGAELVQRYNSDLDVVLLDIQMPELDGLEAARRVRRLDARLIIVFLTNMGQLAVKGYEVDALGYLVKPVPYFAFAAEFERAIERVQRGESDGLVLHTPGGVARVQLSEILYIESSKHRIIVHLFDNNFVLTGTLKAFEQELDGRGFYRSHSGYLVNLRHVTAVDGFSCTVTGNQTLQVSRNRRKGFLAALTDHVGGRAV